MSWLFRHHFWIVHVVLISISAFIMAKTITPLVGYYVSQKIPQKISTQGFRQKTIKPVSKEYDLANERNLFAARREEISLDEEEKGEEVFTGRWQDAQPTNLPLKLVSTMVFSSPFESRAVIQSTSSRETKVYGIKECGDYQKTYDPSRVETILKRENWQPNFACNEIDNLATVKRIEEYRVYIFNEREKRYEYLSLLDKEIARRPVVRETETKEEMGAGVRKVGATSYEIDRKEFDGALANIARLMTEARAIPEIENGNYVGFKIVYIKSGSLFEKIGIERLDVLTRINGYDLNSPEKALQLFSRLKTANQFTIDLKRGDRSVTLDYSVVR